MGIYKASEARQHEFQGADTFRLEKSGDRAQVVFLYTDKDSIDGYTCHRLTNAKFYTYTVDCCKAEKGSCPACDDNVPQSNRIFVKMLDLTNNKVVIWDRASNFRQTLEGFIHYFNPLYGQKYEITKNGEKLKTTYSFQSIGDSGLSEEEYKAYLAKADETIETYVRPADSYDDVKARVATSKAETVEPTPASQAQAWSAAPVPQQTGWGQTPPQNGGWGQTPAPAQPSAPAQNGWGQAPQQTAPASGWGQAPPAQPTGDTPWGNAPQGAWSQNPQG